MAITYSDIKSILARDWQPGSGGEDDPQFLVQLPVIIDNAELRCYRDTDFLACRKSENSSFTGSAPGRALVQPPADIIAIRSFDYFTPAGQDDSSGGTRVPLFQRDESFLKMAYPTRTVTGTPRFWCLLGTQTSPAPATPGLLNLLVCPTPDDVYQIQIGGTFRPDAMTAQNTETFLGEAYPDLLLFACKVELAGAMKNYGRQSDDPQFAVTWEKRYTDARTAAQRQEAQKRSVLWVGRQPIAPSAPPQGTPQA